jgi:hypothetical protein
MGRVIGGAELARPPGGQRLALIAAGEKGEALGIMCANFAQPIDGNSHRLVPADLLELAGSSRADPQQGRGEAGRRILGHDPGGALGAEHALVYWMVAIALDIADPAILQMHLDPAAAGAHVAGRAFDLVGYGAGELDLFLGRRHGRHAPRLAP